MTTKTIKKSVKKTLTKKIEAPQLEIETAFIDLERINLNPQNPRKTFIQNELLELAHSIKGVGLLSPITVRPVGKGYEIVTGEKRYRSFKILAGENPGHYDKIPCIIKELTDKEALEISITENLLRSDVNPFEEAEAFALMVNKFDYKVDDIALRFGKSNVFIYQRLKLKSLCPEGRAYFDQGILTLSHCMELIKISEKDQKEALSVIVKKGQDGDKEIFYTERSHKSVRQWIEQNIQVKLDTACFDLKDEKLDKKVGACVSCPSRSGHNKLLFNDIENDDICFNASCFKNKTDLFIKREITKEEKQGNRVVKISTDHFVYDNDDEDILASREYEVVPEDHKCTNKPSCLAVGIVVDGDGIGTKKIISTDSQCPCQQEEPTPKGSKSESRNSHSQTAEQKRAELISAERISYLNDNIASKVQDQLNNDFKPGGMQLNIASPNLISLLLSSLICQLCDNCESVTISETIEEMFTKEEIEHYKEIEEDFGPIMLFVLKHFEKEEFNTTEHRVNFLVRLVVKQSIRDFGKLHYSKEVSAGEAPNIMYLLASTFSIDVEKTDDFFAIQLQKVIALNIEDEYLFSLAIEVSTKNKTAYSDHELSDYEDLLDLLGLKYESKSTLLEEDSEAEEEQKTILCNQLVDYFTK